MEEPSRFTLLPYYLKYCYMIALHHCSLPEPHASWMQMCLEAVVFPPRRTLQRSPATTNWLMQISWRNDCTDQHVCNLDITTKRPLCLLDRKQMDRPLYVVRFIQCEPIWNICVSLQWLACSHIWWMHNNVLLTCTNAQLKYISW